MAGLLDGQAVGSEVVEALRKDAGDYTWAAATTGSQNAATNQLATGEPVMAIGGFNGSDPSPTLDQFKKYVADGEIHYFFGGGGFGGGGGGGGGQNGTASSISTWVRATFKEVTVGDTTLYDLTATK